MKKIILLLLCVLSIGYVKAYENEYFQIEIPDGYKEEKLEGNAFKWKKDNKYIAVTIADNTENQYNVKYFTSLTIQQQKEYLENSLNKGLSEYDVKVSIADIKKEHDKNNYYLEYTIVFPSTEKTGHNIYQKGRMYTTEHYITSITYSSDTGSDLNDEYNTIVNSFQILDTLITYSSIDPKAYLAAMIILGVIFGVIYYLVSTKKRK